MACLIGRMLCTPIYQESFYYSSLSASITFHGERLSTLYFDITEVARFFTKATFLLVSLYFKNMKGPMLGNAHLDAFALFIKTS